MTLSPYLQELLLALGLAFAISFLLRGLVAVLVSSLPKLPTSSEQTLKWDALEKRYARELARIQVWEYLASIGGLVITPFIFVKAAAWLIILHGERTKVLIHTGALVMTIPLMVAGALAGATFVQGLISSRFPYPQSTELLELYLRTEDRQYGILGRFTRRHGGSIAAFIIVVVALSFGNLYTTVDSSEINVPAGVFSAHRRSIPISQVERLISLRHRRSNGSLSGPECLVFLKDGTILTSKSPFLRKPGLLADLGTSAQEALSVLSEAIGIPVEAIDLSPGQVLSGYDSNTKTR